MFEAYALLQTGQVQKRKAAFICALPEETLDDTMGKALALLKVAVNDWENACLARPAGQHPFS